jgi:hypothetical protein
LHFYKNSILSKERILDLNFSLRKLTLLKN